MGCTCKGFFEIESLGNVIGLNSVTLKYPTAGEEAGYLHHCNGKLLKVWPAIAIIYVVGIVGLIAGSIFNFGLPWQQSTDRILIEMTVFSFRVGGLVQALLQVIIIKSSKLVDCVGNFGIEMGVVFWCVFNSCSCLGRFYIAKLLGHGDPYELFTTNEMPSSYTDTLFVLQLFMVLAISHVCPVRWCSLVVVEIATVLIYGAVICFSWSPEPKKVTCFIHLVILVFLSSYGKRQTEVNDRLVFSSFLNEKTLRMKAEFELSQQQRNSENGSENREASIPETTTTGEAFKGIDPEASLPSSLNAVFSIGKREQWLIDEKELFVDPEACIGVGGFGIVLAGEFNACPAAFKIHKATGMHRSLLAIGNELRLLRKLRHSNIVLFHGACLSLVHNDILLVMERVVGVSMTAFVNGKPSSSEHLQALTGICHALIYLHTRQPAITHGDLKPGNVMIEQRGSQPHAKILDFGLARLITLTAKPGGGTFRWLAPEILKSNSRPSVSSDVFALGLIVYFSATGKTPFQELSSKSLKAHTRARLEPGSALTWPLEDSEFPAKCKLVVNLATRRLPHERPSVQEVHRMISDMGRCDSARSSVGQGASDLWGSLLVARHLVSAKNKSQRFKSFRWLRKVNFVEELPNPSSITPIKEEEHVEDAEVIPATVQDDVLFYPGFTLTPRVFMKVSILETLSSWNASWPNSSCCEYHARLAVLHDVHQELQGYACKRLKKPGSIFLQCPVCSVVIPKENESDVEEGDMFCALCGFEGTPRHCESLHTTNDQDIGTHEILSL